MAPRQSKAQSFEPAANAQREALMALAALVERIAACRGGATYFTAVEVKAWPADLVRALRALDLLASASPATSLECPGCEQACMMPVHVIAGPTAEAVRALIACDKRKDISRVEVPITSLERLRSSGQLLAEAVVKLLGMELARPATVDGHTWRLGQFRGVRHKEELFLRADLEPRLAIAGHTVRLVELLQFKNGAVMLDQPALRKLVDNPTGQVGDGHELSEERARRICKRIADLKTKGVKAFLATVAKEEDLSVARIKQIVAGRSKAKAPNEWHSGLVAAASAASSKKTKRQR